MSIIKETVSRGNLDETINKIKVNKGASVIDEIPIDELELYFNERR